MARIIESFYPKDFLVLEEPYLQLTPWTKGLSATHSLPRRNIFGPGEMSDLVDVRVFLDFNFDTE